MAARCVSLTEIAETELPMRLARLLSVMAVGIADTETPTEQLNAHTVLELVHATLLVLTDAVKEVQRAALDSEEDDSASVQQVLDLAAPLGACRATILTLASTEEEAEIVARIEYALVQLLPQLHGHLGATQGTCGSIQL